MRATIGAIVLATLLTGCTATSPSTDSRPIASASATKRTVPANYHPSPPPKSDALTAAQLTCGSSVPSDVFTSRFNAIAYTDHEAGVQFNFSNTAATPSGRATIVDARLAANASDVAPQPTDGYDGAFRVALVHGGRVVAESAVPSSGAMHALPRFGGTALLSATLTANACDGGARLPDGTYSLVGFGVTVTAYGETTHPAFANPGFHLRNGILTGGTSSAVDGPWRGSGVPTCGTPVSSAAIRRFAAQVSTRLRAEGVAMRITGFEPHANAQGWFFQVRVTDTSDRAVRLTRGTATSAGISHGTIRSAPDSVLPGSRFDSVGDTPSTALKPGAAMTVGVNVPESGCDLSSDGTTSGPGLARGTYLAFIDLGVTTTTGTPLVLTEDYTLKPGARPVLAG